MGNKKDGNDKLLNETESLKARITEFEARERQFQAIRSINQLIITETDSERLIELACENLTETLGYHNAWIALMDKKSQSVTSIAESGFNGGFESMHERLESGEFPACMQRTLMQDELVVVEDPSVECDDCPLVHEYTGCTGLTRRLAHEGCIYGILNVSVPGAFAHDKGEQDLFTRLAGNLAFALHKIEQDQALRSAIDIINSSPVVVFVWENAEGWPVRYASENVQQLYGYSAEEFVSGAMAFADVIHPDDLERVTQEGLLSSADLMTDTVTHIPYRIITKSGDVRWVEDLTTIQRAPDGSVQSYRGILMDITERMQVKQTLLENEERYSTFVTNMSVGIYRIDFAKPIPVDVPDQELAAVISKHAVVGETNTALARMYGLRPDEIAGRPVTDFAPDYGETATMAVRAPQCKLRDHETRDVDKDGHPLYLSENISAVVEDGQLVRIWGIQSDISEQLQAEEALRESEEKYKNFYNSSLVAMFSVTLDGKPFSVNDQGLSLLGYSSEEEFFEEFLVGKHWKNPDQAVRLMALLQETGNIKSVETKQMTVAGESFWAEFSAELSRDTKTVNTVVIDISARKRAEETLERKLAFEKGMTTILARFVGVFNFDEAINASLADIGRLSGADRVYIFQLREEGTLLDNTHEWCAEGVCAVIGNWRNIPADRFPWWMAKLRAGEMIRIGDVSMLPAEASAEKEALESQDIKAELVFPLHVRNELVGYVGFDYMAKVEQWDVEDELFLRMIEQIFESAIDHQRSEERLSFQSMLLNQIQDRITATDLEGYITYVNEAECRTFGKNADELIGQHVEQYGEDSERGATQQQIIETTLREGAWSGKVVNFTEDGSEFILSSRIQVIHGEHGEPVGMLGISTDITEREKAEEALRESEERFHQLFDNMTNGCSIFKSEYGKEFFLTDLNRGAEILDNIRKEDLIGKSFSELLPDVADKGALECMQKTWQTGEPTRFQGEYSIKSGKVYRDNYFYKIPSGEVVLLYYDLTEQKRAEEEKDHLEHQFRQVQRVDAIGRLAGGVAHDLNNLLTPVLLYSEMLLEDFGPEDDRRRSVEQVLNAGLRARDLVRQLLAFGRKQNLEYKLLHINDVLSGFKKLLRRTIREDVQIDILLGPIDKVIKADLGQIEQIIMNLCINAQDAMPEGGRLVLETDCVVLDDQYAADHPGAEPGEYIVLAVSDTGIGMDKETQQHVFEPFFSTKGKSGTGLGLATVYGIVKQHGGNIWLYSEPGEGTTFKVYLPAAEDDVWEEKLPALEQETLSGSETILLVEDNEQVRELTGKLLTKQGYKVVSAENGVAALKLLDKFKDPIHLLLTDVVMPEMNGKDLFIKVLQKRPELKVLYMSGYTDNVIAHRGVLDEDIAFIQKPFSVRGLTAKVRGALG